jgi:hypothetical protein
VVNNNLVASRLHEIRCISEKLNWSALFSSHIVTVAASKAILVVVCKNGSLHLFSPSGRGQRLLPPIHMPSPVYKCTLINDQLAVVTSCALLYIWDLGGQRPKIVMGKESIQSLLTGKSRKV